MSVILERRQALYRELIDSRTLSMDLDGVTSIADSSSVASKAISAQIAQQLGVVPDALPKVGGQTAGKNFETAISRFLSSTFPLLEHLRPGRWTVSNVGSARGRKYLGDYEPYTHLHELAEAIKREPELEAVLGNGYVISPDVMVTRKPEPDEVVNNGLDLVDHDVARRTIIREINARTPFAPEILHAVVSCKWTIRSDRAQNSRSEALNLIRNRKGRLPHVVAVTAEPTPARLSSIALGTGDLDMVYHLALPELMAAVDAVGDETAQALMRTMVDGQRLRDIADLPLDLTI